MQVYTSNNPNKYSNGKQINVAMADGANATVATDFYSLDKFEVQREPEIIPIEDNDGSKSTNTNVVLGNELVPFSFGGTIEVDKIGAWIYLATGKVTTTQDGVTGAYNHAFSILNSVVLPQSTIFYNLDAEHDYGEVGFKRLTGCYVDTLKIDFTQKTAKFEGTGWALAEDNVINSDTEVTVTNVTDIEYQTSGLIRYTFDTTDLSTVENGDVLDTSGASGISNASNIGQYTIVNVDDTNDFVEVINTERSDNTDDETSLTATLTVVTLVTNPVYNDPTAFLLHQHGSVYRDDVGGNFSSSTCEGLGEMSIEIQNNGEPLFEECKSKSAVAILAKNVSMTASFDQIMATTSGRYAKTSKDNSGTNNAWRLNIEDDNIDLGSSTTYHPMLQVDFVNAFGMSARQNMMTGDNLRYAWELAIAEESQTLITLRNEIASYGA